jgi:hypothetical protein
MFVKQKKYAIITSNKVVYIRYNHLAACRGGCGYCIGRQFDAEKERSYVKKIYIDAFSCG